MSNEPDHTPRPTTAEEEDMRAVRSIPLDTDDGGTVVIEQQNMGGAQQVGGGEYKNVRGGRSVDAAAAEQAELERQAPVDDESADQTQQPNPAASADPDSPGLSVLGEQSGPPVEPNEPA
ncbi:MAG: hypothetical protein JWN62_1818 [Acidimicrobiales bacterium]|nr:hypothetical protein [Acidimicrobiales bacterium]